jgi:hypothetical protein
VLNITLPALIFLALVKAPVLPKAYAALPVLLILAELTTMAAAFAIGKALKLPQSIMGMVMMAGVFGNTAFLGYPIALSLFPRAFPAAVMLDEFGMMVLMYVCGAIIGGIFGKQSEDAPPPQEALLKFARGPIFLSIVAAMTIRQIPWPESFSTLRAVHLAGDMSIKSIGYLAQGAIPLILLSVGAALKPRIVFKSPKPILLPCVFKLVICPIAMWAFCRLFGIHNELLQIGLLQASMPTGVIASILCEQHAMEGAMAGGAVFATTVLSVVTIPIALMVLH